MQCEDLAEERRLAGEARALLRRLLPATHRRAREAEAACLQLALLAGDRGAATEHARGVVEVQQPPAIDPLAAQIDIRPPPRSLIVSLRGRERR